MKSDMARMEGAPTARRHGNLWAACLAAVALSASAPAVAEPVFSVSGNAGQNSGAGCASFGLPTPLTSSSSIAGQAECLLTSSAVAARASGGGLGASATVQTFGGSSLSSGATATAQTTFVVNGPDSSVDVSLNLLLDSKMSGNIVGTVGINASIFGFGDVNSVLGSRNGGLLIPSVDCNGCSIQTKTIGLRANQIYDLMLSLSVIADGGLSQVYEGKVDALNTLTFPQIGPVFNLPDGYTATIFGMNVVDNRVVGVVNDVPEPGSLALACGGLMGFW